jgi:hypothetical protein
MNLPIDITQPKRREFPGKERNRIIASRSNKNHTKKKSDGEKGEVQTPVMNSVKIQGNVRGIGTNNT